MTMTPGLEALPLPRGVLKVPENPDRRSLPDLREGGDPGLRAADVAGAGPAPGFEPLTRDRPGDTETFRKLFETHGERMKGVAYQLLRNHSDAEDAVQEAFLKAYRGAESFRGGSAVSTWVYRILVNACHDLRRRRSSREDSLEPDDSKVVLPGSAGTPRDRLRLELDRALEQIQPMNRSVFILFEVEGFRHREIGEMLGIPEGTSKNLLFRARRELQETLVRRRKALEGGTAWE
jgi:RNA polymerase sigma-70 factor (ECF subfamily)